MNTQSRKRQLLRFYAERTLQGNDLMEFRHLAQTDLEFRREAELTRQIRLAAQLGQQERLRDTFNQYQADMLAQENTTVDTWLTRILGGPVLVRWVAAATVVAVVALGLVVWILNRPTGNGLADQGKPATIEQQMITPVFGFAGANSVEMSTTTVLLSPGPTDRPQYRFRNDTLQLYGDAFRPNALTLIVNPAADSVSRYQLRMNGIMYTLDKHATKKTELKQP